MRMLMMCVAVGVILIGCHKSPDNPPSPTTRTLTPPKQLPRDLVAAVKDKAPDTVKALLNAGADPTMAVDNQMSAIDVAAVEIDQSNNAGKLALDWSGKEEQILFLMTSNIDIDGPRFILKGLSQSTQNMAASARLPLNWSQTS